MTRRVVFILLLLSAVTIALVYPELVPETFRVSGFVEADEIRLGSRVGGRVQRVHVDEGDAVAAGDVLVELEPYDLLERQAEAQARLAENTAAYQELQAGFREEEIAQQRAKRDQAAASLQKLVTGPRSQEIDIGRAQLKLAEARLDLARLTHERIASLVTRNTASAGDLDEATASLKVAQAMVEVRRAELAELEEGSRKEDIDASTAELAEAEEAWKLSRSGYRQEEIERAAAAVAGARSAVAAVERQIEELKIRAPVDGVIEAIELQPGDLVTANAPVIALMDSSRHWVRAYIPENRLDIQVGQRVEISVDSYPDRRFRGTVSFVSRQAEFTPRNIQTPEERSKQVFKIKVLLAEGEERLRPGMSADIWFDVLSASEPAR